MSWFKDLLKSCNMYQPVKDQRYRRRRQYKSGKWKCNYGGRTMEF